MQKHKTQQFARFFLKDTKTKLKENQNNKSSIDQLNVPSFDV